MYDTAGCATSSLDLPTLPQYLLQKEIAANVVVKNVTKMVGRCVALK